MGDRKAEGWSDIKCAMKGSSKHVYGRWSRSLYELTYGAFLTPPPFRGRLGGGSFLYQYLLIVQISVSIVRPSPCPHPAREGVRYRTFIFRNIVKTRMGCAAKHNPPVEDQNDDDVIGHAAQVDLADQYRR